jgi:hypothetical protein
MAFNPAIFGQTFEQAFDREFTPAFAAYGPPAAGPRAGPGASNWQIGHAFGQAFGLAFGRSFGVAFAAAAGQRPDSGPAVPATSSGAPDAPGYVSATDMHAILMAQAQLMQHLYPDTSADPYAVERIQNRQERFNVETASPDFGEPELDQSLPTPREAEPEDWWSLDPSKCPELDAELDAIAQTRQRHQTAEITARARERAIKRRDELSAKVTTYDQVVNELKQLRVKE